MCFGTSVFILGLAKEKKRCKREGQKGEDEEGERGERSEGVKERKGLKGRGINDKERSKDKYRYIRRKRAKEN